MLSINLLRRKRRSAAWLGVCLAGCLCAGLWLYKFWAQEKIISAVVVAPSVEAKFAPAANATTHFPLNEGEKVIVLGRSENWWRVKTPQGNIGWVVRNTLEQI